jgi:hypothetical protein
MASSGKKKTTMAKLDRERRMREKRMDKQARKDARKYAAANPVDEQYVDVDADVTDESAASESREPMVGVAGPTR